MLAQVRVQHALVSLDLGRGPAGDAASAREHEDRVAEAEHHRHVVLDDQERLPLPVQLSDHLDDVVDERRIDAAGRLVEHDQARVEHQDLRQLDELLLPEGQRGRPLVGEGPHPDEVEELLGPLRLGAADGVRGELAPGEGPERRDDVLEHGHLAEEPGDLERPPDAPVRALPRRQAVDRLPVEPDLAGVRRHRPVDDVEERRLAGAVRTDQGGDRSLLDLERAAVEGAQAPEAPLDAPHFEQ